MADIEAVAPPQPSPRTHMANMRKAYSERVNELREQMNSMKMGRSLISYSKCVDRENEQQPKKASVPGLNLGFLEADKPKDKENVPTAPDVTSKPSPQKTVMSPEKPKRSVLSPSPEKNLNKTRDDTAKAAEIRDNMEGKVSQETQESVKAALVRTMMNGVVSQDTQDSVKAGMVRTQMESKVSQQTQEHIKQALEMTAAAKPAIVSPPQNSYAVDTAAPTATEGTTTNKCPVETSTEVEHKSERTESTLSPRTQKISARNAEKLNWLRTQIVTAADHQGTAAPIVDQHKEADQFTSARNQPVPNAPEVGTSCVALVPVKDIHNAGSTAQTSFVDVKSRLQARTRQDMQEEVKQILQCRDEDQKLQAILASPISQYYQAREQARVRSGSIDTHRLVQGSEADTNSNVLNRYKNLLNPAERSKRASQLLKQLPPAPPKTAPIALPKPPPAAHSMLISRPVPQHTPLWAAPSPESSDKPLSESELIRPEQLQQELASRVNSSYQRLQQEHQEAHEQAMMNAYKSRQMEMPKEDAPAPTAPAHVVSREQECSRPSLVDQLQSMRQHRGRAPETSIRQQLVAEHAFNQMDTNGDGVIDRQEFQHAMVKQQHSTALCSSPELTPAVHALSSLRSQLLHTGSAASPVISLD